MLENAKEAKAAIPGLVCAILPGGTPVVGTMSFKSPRLAGQPLKKILLAFRYCPWCGKPMPFWSAPENGKGGIMERGELS